MKFLSGCEDFDIFLDGGYISDMINCIYGPAASGKTTLAILAAIEQAKNKKKVFFIDTENGFSVERVKQIHPDLGVMDSVFVIRVKNFEEQCKKINELENIAKTYNIGLIIVDSLGSFYRSEIKEDNSINAKLAKQLRILSYIAHEYNTPVLVTNQVYSLFERDGVRMVGGSMVENWCGLLIRLEKGKRRKAILEKPFNREFIFEIVNKGIMKI